MGRALSRCQGESRSDWIAKKAFGTDITNGSFRVTGMGDAFTVASALRKAGKKFEFVRLSGDDHYLSLKETRLRVLEEVEKFLAADIGTLRLLRSPRPA